MSAPAGFEDAVCGHRVGLFGGGFDPIHNGHLCAARAARDAFELDTVLFIPTGVPPHKSDGNHAPVSDRCAMLRLAIAGEQGFAVSDIEARSVQPSYTVDTVRALIAANPHVSDWFFIFGDDCAAKLHHWRGLDELRRLLRFISIRRNGLLADAGVRDCVALLDLPAHPAASSGIRQALAGRECAGLPLPGAVLSYIQQHGLYSIPVASMRERTYE